MHSLVGYCGTQRYENNSANAGLADLEFGRVVGAGFVAIGRTGGDSSDGMEQLGRIWHDR